MIDHQEIGANERVKPSPGPHHGGQACPVGKPEVGQHVRVADRKLGASFVAHPDGRLQQGEAASAEESFGVRQIAEGKDYFMAALLESHRQWKDRADVPVAHPELPGVQDPAHTTHPTPTILAGM